MRELGLALAFLGPFLFGVLSAAKQSFGLKREQAMLALMLHGEEKIRHSLCPRDELFFDFESEALSRCGFLPALKEGGRRGEDPQEILERYQQALGLSTPLFSCCRRFFSRLGKLDYESQLAFCRTCRGEAQELIGAKEKKAKDQMKVCVTLGAAAGAFAVILLL